MKVSKIYYGISTSHVFVLAQDDLVEVCALMPGKRSPTVTELKEEHWHSVSALVKISESRLGASYGLFDGGVYMDNCGILVERSRNRIMDQLTRAPGQWF